MLDYQLPNRLPANPGDAHLDKGLHAIEDAIVGLVDQAFNLLVQIADDSGELADIEETLDTTLPKVLDTVEHMALAMKHLRYARRLELGRRSHDPIGSLAPSQDARAHDSTCPVACPASKQD